MNLGIGLSALQASQFAIDNISHNIANASTEGYHRQVVTLDASDSQLIGGFYRRGGVQVSDVVRVRDSAVEIAYTSSISDLAQMEEQLDLETQVETFLLPGEGSIQNALTGLFDEISRFSANPGERAIRTSVVNEAVNLAQRTNTLSDQLIGLRDAVSLQLDLEVDALNEKIETLVDLQNRIQASNFQDVPRDLLDQRDQVVNEIAEQIDVQRFEPTQDSLALGLAGSSLSIGATPFEFETFLNEDGNKQIRVVGTEDATNVVSGSIVALTEAHSTLLPEYQDRINSFASTLIQQVDQAHSTGLGLNGPFDNLASARSVEDATVPLNESGIAFPVEKGELYFTVTDPDGNRLTSVISIDPATDSLQDVAAKIGSIDNVQGAVDPATGTLTVLAQPGYGFDFTGRVSTTPPLDNFTGTSVPEIGGDYILSENRQVIVSLVNSGTVGQTESLLANVIDSEGVTIAQVDIGLGYESGSEIELGDGTVISFSAGDVNAGDTFDFQQVGNSDTTGILSALGLNSFFDGDNAENISVNELIVANPDNIASSRSGEIGDTRNLESFILLRDEQVLQEGTLTFENFLAEVTVEIGIDVQSTQTLRSNIEELNFQYEEQRASVSGVDLNEELLNLTQHQRAYDAAVQTIRAMETMFDTLFTIIR